MSSYAFIALAEDYGVYLSISMSRKGPIADILKRHYTTREKVEELISHGNLFRLREAPVHASEQLLAVGGRLGGAFDLDVSPLPHPLRRCGDSSGHEAKRYAFIPMVAAARKKGARRLLVFDDGWVEMKLRRA